MELYDLLADPETDTASSSTLMFVRMKLNNLVKDLVLILRSDPMSSVLYSNPNGERRPAVCIGASTRLGLQLQTDIDSSPRWRKLDGVANKVTDDLTHLLLVNMEREVEKRRFR